MSKTQITSAMQFAGRQPETVDRCRSISSAHNEPLRPTLAIVLSSGTSHAGRADVVCDGQGWNFVDIDMLGTLLCQGTIGYCPDLGGLKMTTALGKGAEFFDWPNLSRPRK